MENDIKLVEPKVILADPIGFCFGVERAVNLLEEALKVHGKVYCIGSPIHNPQETARLENKGLVVVDSGEEIPNGSAVFVRAHGLPEGDRRELLNRGHSLIDGTCPFVFKAQKKASFLISQGYRVLILGDKDHPEVKAITQHLGERSSVVLPGEPLPEEVSGGKVGIISQTTQRLEDLANLVQLVVPKASELRVYNTICGATEARQKAVAELAGITDGVVVIGGKNSANTRKLFEIALERNNQAIWIEEASELDWRWLEGKSIIGVAAGASTPDWLIDDFLKLLGKAKGVVKEDGR
nr:4-hydroxy-3-methylbut-2-enyl diphosphate reductase [Thermovirga lienii]